MLGSKEFRELLIADVALVRGVAASRDVAMALQRYWDDRGKDGSGVVSQLCRLTGKDREAFADAEAEADRLVGEAGGDPQAALTRRGALGRSLHVAGAMPPGAGSQAPPLRTLREGRYVDFFVAGEGGFGIVYLALDSEMNRLVAFKMIRPDLGEKQQAPAPQDPIHASPPPPHTPASQAFEELKARFLQEAWVTGALEHPGIVPVYEVGTTPQGIPFYTMRFVRGQRTLADAIEDAQEHGVEGRLALLEPFLRLCDTLRYAHAKGVIHRDLKPANVALGEFGEVVLLDWGLARVQDREDPAASRWQQRLQEYRSEADLRTLTGAMGSPGYMAPEAALGNVAEVDARSDVYSLGAILYQVLTGRLPFSFRSFAEYASRVVAETPTSARTVDPGVPEALSALCDRALSRAKADRPISVDDLAQAIRSWQTESALEREVAAGVRECEAALAAGGASRGAARLAEADRAHAALLRTEELAPRDARLPALREAALGLREAAIAERERLARRRVALRLGAAALVVAAATAGILLLWTDRKRREAEDARTAEVAARADAEDLVGFLLYDLRDRLTKAGQLALLKPVALRALAYYEGLPNEHASFEARRRQGVALNNLGGVLSQQGEHEGARRALEAHRRLAEDLLREDPTHARLRSDLAVALSELASLARRSGDPEEAARLYEAARDERLRLQKEHPEDPDAVGRLIDAMLDVAAMARVRGRSQTALETTQQAEALARTLAERRARLEGVSDTRLADAMSELARLAEGSADAETARLRFSEAVELYRARRATTPDDQRVALAEGRMLVEWAVFEHRQGRDSEARRLGEAACVLLRGVLAGEPTHADAATLLVAALSQLAVSSLEAKAEEQALTAHREIVEVLRRQVALHPERPDLLEMLADRTSMLAWTLGREGRGEEALRAHQETEELYGRLPPPLATQAAPRIARSQNLTRMGDALADRGEDEAALARLVMARDQAEALVRERPEDPEARDARAEAAASEGAVLARLGRPQEAVERLAAALADYDHLVQLAPRDDTYWEGRAWVAQDLAKIQQLLGPRVASLPSWRKAMESFQALDALGPDPGEYAIEVATAMGQVVSLLAHQGEHVESLELARRLVDIVDALAHRHADAVDVRVLRAATHERLGAMFVATGQVEEAIDAFEEALDLAQSVEDAAQLREAGFDPTKTRAQVEALERTERMVEGDLKPATVAEHLQLARVLGHRGALPRALEHYAVVLQDDPHLAHEAARTAMRAALADPDQAPALQKRALQWVRADLRSRRQALQAVEAAGDAAKTHEARGDLAILLTLLREDPGLALLRAHPSFEKVLGEE